MTVTTLERDASTTTSRFHAAYSEAVVAGEEDRADIVTKRASKEWTENPAETIRSQLETLAAIYYERQDFDRHQLHGTTHEFIEFGVPDYEVRTLEVMCLIHDTYSSLHKEYQGRSYAVDMYNTDEHTRIEVSALGEVQVYMYTGKEKQRVYDEELQKQIVLEFEIRCSQAYDTQLKRTVEERAQADTHALSLLHERRYGRAKVVAATE